MNAKDMITSLKSDKKTAIIIIIGIIGIFLLAISNYSDTQSIDSNEDSTTQSTQQSISLEDIEAQLEERLVSVISSVKGAGKTQVMVTVASLGEYVYAENEKTDINADSTSSDTEIVVFEQDGDDTGLILTVKSPEVRGVAVVCEGGDSSVIKAEIINLVTSLFGIGSDKVYVGSKAVN